MAKANNHHLDDIEKKLREKGVRFTDQRRLVFNIIDQNKKPITAYDILAEMGKTIDNPKPPTVYRAIDFLIENSLIHKIESLNAFMTCHAGHSHQGSQFMVCDICGDVEEIHLCDLPETLQKKIDQTKFRLGRWTAELHGACYSCQK